jgi:hypothetical protein
MGISKLKKANLKKDVILPQPNLRYSKTSAKGKTHNEA